MLSMLNDDVGCGLDGDDDADTDGDHDDGYDEDNVVFIGPMFIVHRKLQRSLSLKISLQSFLKHAQDPCKAQLSLIFRQFNKKLFLSNLRHLLIEKRLTLS